MFSHVMSAGIKGIDGFLVHVEADVSDGFPRFDLVGLLDLAVKESAERVRTAVKNSRIPFPYKRITITLAPADVRKEGPLYDLPIAVAILAAEGIVSDSLLNETIILGELSLNGLIRPVNGILPMVYSAYQAGFKRVIIPRDNVKEGAAIDGIDVIGAAHLSEVIQYLNGSLYIDPAEDESGESPTHRAANDQIDFSQIKGQKNVRRALEIAAAGMHNILLIGPPGSGKTMMARALASILPDLTFKERIEITKIYSVSGLLKGVDALISKRPFRDPHHTISQAALVGGGSMPRPGEISLAHHGVLFLDELPEFKKNVLEVLRQPMEEGGVTISRVNSTITYPSDFMLACAMNPCPCGYYPDYEKCSCTPPQVNRYLGKISGPLLDRIDLHVEAKRVGYEEMNKNDPEEASEVIRKRVAQAQEIQKARLKGREPFFNASLAHKDIKKYCQVDARGHALLQSVYEKLNLSGRGYHRILKVARTIADLEGQEKINEKHIAEAIRFRSLDRISL